MMPLGGIIGPITDDAAVTAAENRFGYHYSIKYKKNEGNKKSILVELDGYVNGGAYVDI